MDMTLRSAAELEELLRRCDNLIADPNVSEAAKVGLQKRKAEVVEARRVGRRDVGWEDSLDEKVRALERALEKL